MKVKVLKADGTPELDKAGRPVRMHSVDAKAQIRSGNMVEVERKPFKDSKGNKGTTLISVRPKTAADKAQETKEKKARIAKLQQEIQQEEQSLTASEAKEELPNEPELIEDEEDMFSVEEPATEKTNQRRRRNSSKK
jgi:hypothetical protein